MADAAQVAYAVGTDQNAGSSILSYAGSKQLADVELPNLSRQSSRLDLPKAGTVVDSVKNTFDGDLIKEYVKDIKYNTDREIPNSQIAELKNALRIKEYKKLSPVEVAKHRSEFNKVKNSLIEEWEEKTGQIWPTYSEDVIGKNGKVVRKAGSRYDAHHIIENSYGGNNEWWNIHPAKFPNEHQAGIHRADSPARDLFK